MAKQEQAINTVKMDDERLVDFSGKRKMLKSSIITADGQLQVRLDFVNGETRLFTLPSALVNKFALHGAEQKLGDEIAGVDDVEDCIMAVDSLTDRLNQGTEEAWTAKRESSGMAGTSILAKALVEHSGKPIEQIKAFLLNKTHAEKVALRANAAIKPIVDRLEANKTAKKSGVDTDSLLTELATGETKVALAPTSTGAATSDTAPEAGTVETAQPVAGTMAEAMTDAVSEADAPKGKGKKAA